MAQPLPGAGGDSSGRVPSPDPSPDPALPRDKSPRGGFARRRARVGWGRHPVPSPRPQPKFPQGCSRVRVRVRVRAPHGQGRGSRGVPEPRSAAHGGETGRDGIPGIRESRLGWENPAPRVGSRGKAPGPRGSGPGDSAPAAPGSAPQPRGFIPAFQRAPLFPPAVLREALSAGFAPARPSEHHAEFWEVLARPAPPGPAPRGRSRLVPAQIRARAGINGLGHSGAVTTH